MTGGRGRGGIRFRLYVDGVLADEWWIGAGAGDADAVAEAVMARHAAVAVAAHVHGRPWLLECYDPGLPEGEAYLRMGTDARGMVCPAPVVSQEQLEAVVDRRYGRGLN